jgi:hypothetical protein
MKFGLFNVSLAAARFEFIRPTSETLEGSSTPRFSFQNWLPITTNPLVWPTLRLVGVSSTARFGLLQPIQEGDLQTLFVPITGAQSPELTVSDSHGHDDVFVVVVRVVNGP